MNRALAAILMFIYAASATAATIGQACTQRQHNGITQWRIQNPTHPGRQDLCATVYEGESGANWYADVSSMADLQQPIIFHTREEAFAYVNARDLPRHLALANP